MGTLVGNAINAAHAILKLEGLSPLRIHARQDSDSETLGNQTPEAEFRAAFTVIKETDPNSFAPGIFGFPARWLFGALKTANGGALIGVTITGGSLLQLHAPYPTMGKDPVNRDGVRGFCFYAEFFPWEIIVPVFFDQNRVSQERLLHLFDDAGLRIGLGDFRPEKGAGYGTFRVKEVTRGTVHV